MFSLIGNILLSSIAFIFGLVWPANILLPIFYGIPKALKLVNKGYVKPICIFYYLISPIIGLLVIFIIWYFSPEFINRIEVKIGVGIFLLKTIFSKSTKFDMQKDFNEFIHTHLTTKGRKYL
ncbi:MAG: hypothetical protein ISR83_04120 [Candidatus Marinimicrobia bacterium]|nr:hypothetical protein [Candidatus Neomarinimicrobiota bacterium]